MRSRDSALLLAALLGGCGGGGAVPPPATLARVAPADVAYDAVGYATWYGEEVGSAPTASGEHFDSAAMTAAHRTLPLGAVVEVTALDSGRTILVRINDRGPGDPRRLIDLSRGAAQALGVDRHPMAGVRVRSIVPAPADLAALRQGRQAAQRLDAPPALLAALRRQLTPAANAAAMPVRTTASPARVVPMADAPPPRRASPSPRLQTPLPGGSYVQVAAFGSQARAQALADRLHGSVLAATAGGLFRVRLGPFATAAAAQRARDAAVAGGYGDATIVHP